MEINHLDWMKRTHSYTKINREIERGGDGVGVEEGDRDVALLILSATIVLSLYFCVGLPMPYCNCWSQKIETTPRPSHIAMLE